MRPEPLAASDFAQASSRKAVTWGLKEREVILVGRPGRQAYKRLRTLAVAAVCYASTPSMTKSATSIIIWDLAQAERVVRCVRSEALESCGT